MSIATDTIHDDVDSTFPPERGRSAFHRRDERALLLAIFVLCGTFFYWTATSAAGPIRLGATQIDYYNQLTDGFLKGQLSIATPAPAGLVQLSDPYNPKLNAPYQGMFHDLSLYHGHLYLEWGPTPVLTLFLPWRILHIGQLPQNFAVLLYVLAGLAFVLAALDKAAATFAPHASAWKLACCGIVLGLGSVGAYLLRRPDVYEVAESAGYCFSGAGLYFLARGALGPIRRWSLALASVAIGLAAGARFNLLVLGLLLVAAAAACDYRIRRGERSARIANAAIVLVPFALIALLILIYNALRFGSPLQIGSSYQLAGRDPTTTPFNQLGYLAPSLWYYLVAPVRLTFAFPFIALPPPPSYPGTLPATFTPELIGGILTTSPFLWLLAVIPVRWRSRDVAVRFVVTALLVTGAIVVALIAYGPPGATMRYETDFATLFLLAAVLSLLTTAPRRRAGRFGLATVAVVLALVTVVVGVAISITGPDDELRIDNVVAYDRFESVASVLPTLATKVLGHAAIVRVIDPVALYPANLGDYGTYEPGRSFNLYEVPEEVDVIAPSTGRYEFSADLTRGADAPLGGIRVTFASYTTSVTFGLRNGTKTVVLPLVAGLNRLEFSTSTSHATTSGIVTVIAVGRDLQVHAAPTG